MDSEFSPELALVCPDLAARARASLPERPWEVFAPSRTAIERIGPPPRAGVEHGRTWPARVSAAFPLVMLAGFVALLIVGSLPGLSQRPTLSPPAEAPVQQTVPAEATGISRECPGHALC